MLGKLAGSEFFSRHSPMFASAMRLMVGAILLLVFTWAAAETPADQKSSPTPKATPEPTPIPLAECPSRDAGNDHHTRGDRCKCLEGSVQHGCFVTRLSQLTGELNPRLAEDTKLLSTSPSLDILYRIKLTWEDFGRNLSVLARELTQQATSLEQELVRFGSIGEDLGQRLSRWPNRATFRRNLCKMPLTQSRKGVRRLRRPAHVF